MNIVILAEVSAKRVIGGAERVLRRQALGLADLGHQVTILTRAPRGDSRLYVDIGPVKEYRYDVARRHELSFVQSSVAESVRVFDQVCATHPPDAVLIHQALAGLGPITRRFATAPVWVYVCLSLAHEEYLTRNDRPPSLLGGVRRRVNSWARRRIEGSVMRRCHRVLVLSEFMRRRVVGIHAVPEQEVHLAPGAADPAQFTPAPDRAQVRDALKLPRRGLIFFTVRNLVPRMGLDNLVRAVAALPTEVRQDLMVLIGGEGPLRPYLEGLIREHRLFPHVRLLGFVPEEQLTSYYQAADLVVMPTAQLEGFGLVTVEALACGTPVLGTPVAATPEILLKVDRSLVAEGADAQSLATALRRLIRRFRESPEFHRQLARRGRLLVEQEYNWRQHCLLVEQGLQNGSSDEYQAAA
jgi:glycosyltransferase involved in cell wall biosynthesis